MTLATSSELGAPASIMGLELSVYLAPVLFLALIPECPKRSVTGSSSVQFYEVELGCSEVSALRRPPTMVRRYTASLKATTVCRTPVSQVSRLGIL
jgi:hypothetical protein